MKRAWLAIVWIASVAVAYELGAWGRFTEAPLETPRAPPPPNAEAAAIHADAAHPAVDVDPPPPRLEGRDSAGTPRDWLRPLHPTALANSIHDDAYAALVQWIDTMLRSGRRGRLELLRYVDRIRTTEPPEEEGPEWLWPEPGGLDTLKRRLWLAHLSEEEDVVHAFVDDVLRMVEETSDELAALEHGPSLAPFDEILETMPLRLAPEKFGALRDRFTTLWAERGSLPKRLGEFVELDVGDLLARWAMLTPEAEAVERLGRADLHPDERGALLDRLPKTSWVRVDLQAQLAHFVDDDCWNQALYLTTRMDRQSVGWGDLQAALVDALARGDAGFLHGKNFLRRAGWTMWEDARPFVEACLFRGYRSGREVLLVLGDVTGGPSQAEVRAWLRQSGLDPRIATYLRSRYKP